MNDPQATTAIATIVQDVLLVINAIFVFLYLRETRKLRVAAEQQLNTAQKQLDAIKGQVEIQQNQLEAQIKPAIVARMQTNGIELINIGTGPALHVRLKAAPKGLRDLTKLELLPQDRIGFLEPKEVRQTIIHVFGKTNFPNAPLLQDRNFWCEYRSLSGRTYATEVIFDGDDGVRDTLFSELTK